jgi:hypothetical protein
MSHLLHYHDVNFPGQTNDLDITSNNSRERPPQLNEKVCGCHCHTGNSCYCTQAVADHSDSNSDGESRSEDITSEVQAMVHGFGELRVDGDSYNGDSDIDLGSESLSSSCAPYQFYNLDSFEYEDMVAPPEHLYEFLEYLNEIVNTENVPDGFGEDLDAPFNGPRRHPVSPRLASSASSTEVNYSTGDHSLISSMMSSAMYRSGTPSYYTRCVGYRFQSPPPQPSRFLELTPPLRPSWMAPMLATFHSMERTHRPH